MKDEVIELLAPELLTKYRRWRPLFTAAQFVAALLPILAQIIAVWDVQVYYGRHEALAFWSLYAGVAVWVIAVVLEKRMTRGVSEIGPLFASKTRWLLSGIWMAGSVTAYATLNTIYDPWFPR